MIVVIRKNWNVQHLAVMVRVISRAIIRHIEVFPDVQEQINQKPNHAVDKIQSH